MYMYLLYFSRGVYQR